MNFGETEVGRVDGPHVHALCTGFVRGYCRSIASGDRATAICSEGVHYCPRHALYSPARSSCQRCFDLGLLPNQQQPDQARDAREPASWRGGARAREPSRRPSPSRDGPQGRGGRGGSGSDAGILAKASAAAEASAAANGSHPTARTSTCLHSA